MNEDVILERLTPEETINSFVLPHGLNKRDKAKADSQLVDILNNKRAAIDKKLKLELQLLQFKFLLEDYIKSSEYNDSYSFGFFLQNYLTILNKTKKDFADEIDVSPSSLSQWLNSDRFPNEDIMMRLEIHSNHIIPALNWLKVIEKRTEHHFISKSAALKQAQKAHVKRNFDFTF